MQTHNFYQTAKRRRAFTLVEMIVVITIMAILTVIAVAVAPRFQENQRVVKGADQISQWLLTARVRALRDQVATGVRLSPDPNNSSLVRELQYIQQPDDFIVMVPNPSGGQPLVRRIGFNPMTNTYDLEPAPPGTPDFSGGLGNPALWPVQAGDHIEFLGTGLVHLIAPISSTSLQLASNPSNQINLTPQYRIIRAPRVLTGETPLDLPKDVAIDAGQSVLVTTALGLPLPLDILFSPSGGVLNQPGVAGKIIFWVRDTSKDPSAPGEQFLVVIQVRTGFIAVHPVDAYSGLPYRFANDDRSSGL